jgi:iron donor protein CyaY
MEEPEFRQRADEALQSLYSRLAEAADHFDFDVEMNAGALRVDFEDPPDRFVVSPNAPVRQIWVSAHVQSFKLDWNAARGAFVLPASGESLEDLMAGAIRKHIPDFVL